MSLHGARWKAGTFDTGASSMVPPAPVDGAMISWRRGHRLHTRKGYIHKAHDEDAVADAREQYRCLYKHVVGTLFTCICAPPQLAGGALPPGSRHTCPWRGHGDQNGCSPGKDSASRGMRQPRCWLSFSRAFHHLSQTRRSAVRAMCGSKAGNRPESHVPHHPASRGSSSRHTCWLNQAMISRRGRLRTASAS
jgi:hypothetical protein